MKLGMVAKQGALGASAAPRPGVKAGGVDPPLSEARSEIARNGVMCSQRASQRRLIVGNRSLVRDANHTRPERCMMSASSAACTRNDLVEGRGKV